ncbi:hypothetical protein MUK42_09099 [Musa troglodytarum]|uniref:Uncharacterized protein n=1 Tax=Musa troglodytarum TaxID=320322 RepID=A0A9E7E829_9LILI|nr:hypothetical protein MUK42_09099 [Musa troglodytarum]
MLSCVCCQMISSQHKFSCGDHSTCCPLRRGIHEAPLGYINKHSNPLGNHCFCELFIDSYMITKWMSFQSFLLHGGFLNSYRAMLPEDYKCAVADGFAIN